MDYQKLLSLGAVALAVSACVVVYILHRQTTARLDALTQANLGITHTLHRLIASSMSHQNIPSENVISGNESKPISDDTVTVRKELRTDSAADRIIVSDDDDCSDSENDSDDGSENDSDDNDSVIVSSDENNTDDDNDHDSDDDDDDNKTIELGEPISQKNDSIVINSIMLSNHEDIPSDDSSNSEDMSDDDDDEDDDDDDGSESDSEEVNYQNSVITTNQNQDDSTDDKLDIVAFLLPPTQPNNIDIGIIPISSKQKSMIPHENTETISNSIDGLKQMKVEELRKMAVSKLGMSEDEAKKLKKPQLLQKLQGESHT